ncbi:hypothetical protein SCA6_000706 [Theobroma cacao]
MLLPVPADIDIANSVEPFHISEIAKDLNLSSNHYNLYGKYKAKVFSLFLFGYYDNSHMPISLDFDVLLPALDELQGSEDGYYVVVGGLHRLHLEKASTLLQLVCAKLWVLFLIKSFDIGILADGTIFAQRNICQAS